MANYENLFVKDYRTEWVVPETVSTQRSTHVIVRSEGPGQFVVSFFEQRLPVIVGSREQQIKQIDEIEEVPLVCVARLILSAESLVAFSTAFKECVDHFDLQEMELPENLREEEKGEHDHDTDA